MPRLSDIPGKTSLSELLAMLGSLETAQLDFKRQPAKLGELIPSMAMTEGGLIVIGINDDRTIHGCSLDQRVHDAVTRAARDVGVDVQVKSIEVDNTPIVVIAVPEVRNRIVTTTDGRLLRRVGSDTTPLVGDTMARFVQERLQSPAEEDALVELDGRMLDLDLVNEALRQARREPIHDYESLLRALIDLDVAIPQAPPADPKVLVAAMLMFGVRPQDAVPGAAVQLIRRTGVGPRLGPTADRVEVSGPIPRLVDDCMTFIAQHTKTHQAVVGRRRLTVPEYPEAVLREALLNALAHRDYGLQGSTVDVTVWDDRIEIKSPGGLPGPITLENIRQEHYSRNRRLMRTLKLLGLVEEFGEGVDRMFDEMEARLMDPPVITATPTSVVVTLHNRFLVSVEEQAWLSMLGHMSLTTHERMALALARREGSVTRRQLKRAVPGADVEALLRGAVAKGLLIRTGQAGGTAYVLSDEVIMRAGSSGVEAQARKRQMLLDEARRLGSLSTAEGADLLGEDPVLVRHLLNDLVAAGELVARGQTRARRYHPN